MDVLARGIQIQSESRGSGCFSFPEVGLDGILIFVCQHSSEIKDRPLENLINGWGGPNTCYIRGVHFSSAQFQK